MIPTRISIPPISQRPWKLFVSDGGMYIEDATGALVSDIGYTRNDVDSDETWASLVADHEHMVAAVNTAAVDEKGARLIAAAPKMLAALRAALPLVEAACIDGDVEEQIRAAIAAAIGDDGVGR